MHEDGSAGEDGLTARPGPSSFDTTVAHPARVALLASGPEGAPAYIQAAARDTDVIIREAARVLDLTQPVAVTALMILQYIPDSDHPEHIVHRLMEAVPSGSYLTISDTAGDIDASRVAAATGTLNAQMGPVKLTLRSRDQIARCFTGLDMVEPGLVPLPQWRADAEPEHVIPCYAGMGRKP